MALNGGPIFTFNEAVSFQVHCERGRSGSYWDALSAGGDAEAQQCGWLKDQYGVSWQIVPTVLGEMLKEGDPESQPCHASRAANEETRHSTLQKAYEG